MKKLISVLLTTAMLISILSVGTSAANVIEGSVSTEIISPENPAHPYLLEPGPNEPNWGSGYNSTHQFITGNAIKLPILVKVNKEKVIRPKSDDIELTNLWDEIDDCHSCLLG